MKKVVILTMVLSTVAWVPSFGTIAFSTGFEGPGLDANLQDPSGAFTISGTAFNTAGADRRYLSTIETSYNSVPTWTAELVFVTPTGEHGGIYYGLGSAVPDPSYYDEPSNSIFANFFHLSWHPDGMLVQKHTSGGVQTSTLQAFPQFASGSPQRAIITKSGDSITFALDINNDGGVDYTSNAYSLASDAPFLNNTNSRIFFGTTESGIQFDSLTVTPEPATMGLMLLGVVRVLRRR